MTPVPCIPADEIAAVLALAESDPRRAHLASCPRCRALADAYRAFLAPGDVPAAARADEADARLSAWREQWLGGSAATAPAARREEPARSWWAALSAAALRPAWAFAALVVVAGAVLVIARRPAEGPQVVLRGGAPSDFVAAPAQWQPDGAVRLTWSRAPEAARYEVRLFSTALEPLATLAAGLDTTRLLAADSLPAAVRGGGAVLWRVAAVRGDGSETLSPVGTLRRP